MPNNSLLINQGTNSAVNFDSNGGTFTQVIAPSYGTISTIGTLPNLPGGSVVVTAGTVAQSGAWSVTGTVAGGTIQAATISVLPNLPGGTLNLGTVQSTGTVNVGTVNTGTINTGTINLGTVVGKDANAVAQTGNPLGVGGTDSGGTIRTIKVDSGGLQRIGLDSGTVSVLPNLPGGTLNLGTVQSTGTVNVGTINAGTINTGTVNAGTINTGTINTGTINLGTFVGKDANAVAQTGNPISIGGTDSGGTVRTVLVNSAGALSVAGAAAGTFVNLSTGTLNVGTFNTGTVNTGTINTGTINLGTVVGKDANAVAQTGNPLAIGGTDSGGTVRTVLVNSAGAMSVSGASSGTFNNISTGTMQTLGTLGTVQNILAGTISGLQNGTITSGSIIVTVGTVSAGTINTGTINLGTVVGKDANGVVQTGNPIVIAGTNVGGSVLSLQVDASGNLKTTGVANGTTVGTVNVGTINTGTINTGTVNTGTINVATVTAGSIVVTAGTVIGNGGSMIGYGPAAAAAAAVGNPLNVGGTDSGGTIRTIKVDSGGLLRVGVDSGTISVLPNLPQGSITVTAGTIASVGTIGTLGLGTITGNLGTIGTIGLGTVVSTGTVNVGTINTGTINAGTFSMTAGTLSPLPTIANVTYGTHGTTGVSVFGTLAGGTGSGAGTEIFITSLSLTIPSTGGSQDVSIGWGTNAGTFQAGTGLLVRGNYPAGGGIQKTFWPPSNSGTNSQLCLFQAGAGTVDVSVTYFIAPSAL